MEIHHIGELAALFGVGIVFMAISGALVGFLSAVAGPWKLPETANSDTLMERILQCALGGAIVGVVIAFAIFAAGQD